MKWILISGGVLLAGALAFVAVMTAPAPRPTGGAPGLSTPAPPFAPSLSRPAVNLPDRGERESDRPPVHPDPGDVRPRATPPEPVAPIALPKDPSARLLALEPLRREVLAGLGEMRGRVAHCELPHATLLVALETLDGAVRIADARLEALPASGDPRAPADASAVGERAAHCVRSALAGNVIGAPSATPGRRWEMPFETGPQD